MPEPLISIITPCYNAENYIEDTLRSVRDQPVNNVEHLIIDGGSTDKTLNILEEYENQYNLKWVSEPDQGQSDAVNKGIKMANGEWIGWINADDYYLNSVFDKITDKINNNMDSDIIYGDLLFVNEKKEKLFEYYSTRPSRIIELYWSHFATNHSTFFNKSTLTELDCLDESLEYTMDADLFWKLLHVENLDYVHLPMFIGVRRLHSQAKTVNKHKEVKRKIISEHKKIYGDHIWTKNTVRNLMSPIGYLLKCVYLLLDGIENNNRSLREILTAMYNEIARPIKKRTVYRG